MKLRINVEGEDCLLDLQPAPGSSLYTLHGVHSASGKASIAEISPGVFSILLGYRSYTVCLVRQTGNVEAWTAGRRYLLTVADVRDRPARQKKSPAIGALEIRAQMPGKIVKLLVELGSVVQNGQPLIVIEAMKMQNEVKSPRDGAISRIYVVEGATVAAAQSLLVIE